MIAPQMVVGLLQKVAMTSMPEAMAELGSGTWISMPAGLRRSSGSGWMRVWSSCGRETGKRKRGRAAGRTRRENAGLIAVKARAVVGENKTNPMVSFYAAAIGVMFLLFTASGSAGSLLDEAESGTLDRVLSSRVTMTKLLAGKLAFNTLLAFCSWW